MRAVSSPTRTSTSTRHWRVHLLRRVLQARLAKFARTLTIHWSGAEQLTRWCYRHGLRYLFRPAGIAIAALVAIGGVAAFVAVATTHGLDYDTRSLGAGVALLFALNMVLIFIHELGHAAVLVHYQRRVRGAGFRLYFGTPAFFVDSSDALMLDRKARIAQSFGGPYFELVASGVAAIALWMWPHGYLAPTLFAFVVVNYYVVLINLTPMLELDGYWMFSDAIRVPDLRPRSLAFVRYDLWAKVRHRERFSASEIGLLLFGTVGVAFTIFVLVSAFWFWERTFGGLLESLWNAGPAGIFGLAVLVAFLAAPIIRGVLALARAIGRLVGTWLQRARLPLAAPVAHRSGRAARCVALVRRPPRRRLERHRRARRAPRSRRRCCRGPPGRSSRRLLHDPRWHARRRRGGRLRI